MLNEKLALNDGGDSYLVSGKANHNIYNRLDRELLKKSRGNINILTGPIITVPDSASDKRQELHAYENSIIRFAEEGLISLFPSETRQQSH